MFYVKEFDLNILTHYLYVIESDYFSQLTDKDEEKLQIITGILIRNQGLQVLNYQPVTKQVYLKCQLIKNQTVA